MNHRKTNEGLEENLPGLIAAARAGDQQAFTELYEATDQEVYRTARAVLQSEQMALDIQQDTFVYAFTHLDKLEDPAKLRPWLRAIAVNQARSALRKNTPVLFSELETDEGGGLPEQADPSPEVSPEMSLDRKETTALVNEILDGLSPGQRAAVGMYYYEQMPVHEIAEALGVNAGTVKTQLARGRKKIEEAVRRLEQKGIQLYGLSPLPFLVALMRRQSPSAQASGSVLTQTLEKAGVSAGAKAVAAAAGSGAKAVAIHVGRSFFETGVGRLVLGVIVAGVIGGGAAGWCWYETHRSESEIRTTEAPEELRVIPTAPPHTREEAIAVTAPQEDTGEDLISEPVTTEPQSTEPQPTEPQPTESQPTEPQPTEPKPTEPKPTEPKPTEPAPAEPEPAEPAPAEPTPAEPTPTEPTPAEPSPTEPKPTEPKPTEPGPPESESTEPPEAHVYLASGSCGKDLTWTLDGDTGLLSIEGGGVMNGFWGDSCWLPYRDRVTQVSLPDGLTSIGVGAFSGCDQLTKVSFPDTLQTIDDDAFRDCTRLTDVSFPAGLKEIGSWAFRGCNGLTRVVLPESLTRLGWGAFSDCDGLTGFTLPASLVSLVDSTFCDCDSLTSAAIPDGCQSTGVGIFSGCCNLTDISLPNSLRVIDAESFQGTGLTEIVIPNGVERIGWNAFEGCEGLHSVQFSKNLNCIAFFAFRNCTNLTNVTLPSGLKTIELYSFQGCTGLTQVVLPETLETIGSSAFADCPALTSVTIPASVTSIGDEAFGYKTSPYLVKIRDFTIYGAAGSVAQTYAEENGFRFIES